MGDQTQGSVSDKNQACEMTGDKQAEMTSPTQGLESETTQMSEYRRLTGEKKGIPNTKGQKSKENTGQRREQTPWKTQQTTQEKRPRAQYKRAKYT